MRNILPFLSLGPGALAASLGNFKIETERARALEAIISN
jgi:hypothetical protein